MGPQDHSPILGKLRISRFLVVCTILPQHAIAHSEGTGAAIQQCCQIQHDGPAELCRRTHGGFLELGYAQIIHLNGIFPHKPSIWGYPPFAETPTYLPGGAKKKQNE